MRRTLAALALIVAAAALAGCAGLGAEEDVSLVPEQDRTTAPAFRVPALDGSGEVSLADHAGRVVVLNFWASWCAPCRNEMPALVEFADATPGVDVVGLAVTDRPADSRDFAREFGVDYDLGIDRRGDTIARYGASGLPVTVFVDEEGRVAQTAFGELTREQLNAYADLLGA
jgi:cytochrome c biogenesis protein CcmG, thiol:disulfide interchange protein DsbE